MSQSMKITNRLVLAIGMSAALLPALLPQAAHAQYQYSTQLVERYTTGCSKELVKKGYSGAQAQSLCVCSLRQMQRQHSQSSAIVVLTSAQLNPVKDPKIGLPNTLSKYFTPCFG